MAKTGEHRSELGQWRTTQRLADPRLRAYVHGYFASSSSLHVAVRERHVPSPEVPLLLNFGAPHRRLDVEGRRGSTAHDGVWVVGLHDRHQLTKAAGEREFMVVRFTPLGAHLFLGLPMHLIANEAVDLALINPALARGLVSRIAAAGSWVERFAAMEALIAERLTDAEIPASIGFAWHRLVAADGRIAIGSLASDAGCSHRDSDCEIPDVGRTPPQDRGAAAALQSRVALTRPAEPHATERACEQTVYRDHAGR